MKALVTVMPKPSVLDPQGAAVAQAMAHLGHTGARKVRVGRSIEIDFGSASVDESQFHSLCRDLLSNPVIEDYTLEILP